MKNSKKLSAEIVNQNNFFTKKYNSNTMQKNLGTQSPKQKRIYKWHIQDPLKEIIKYTAIITLTTQEKILFLLIKNSYTEAKLSFAPLAIPLGML